jgi:SnoaL-like domain
MTHAVTTWIDGYVRAWNSNDPHEIGALFTGNAQYSTEPYRPPRRGRDAIVAWWLDNHDEPGETTFTWQPLAVTEDVAIVTGTTVYPDRTFSNLWIIRLTPDGECREFAEWWMEHPGDA